MTKEYPILFDGTEVRAILDGRMTQTWRPIKPPDPTWTYSIIDDGEDGLPWLYHADDLGDYHRVPCPYGSPGEYLWGRETFAIESNWGVGDIYDAPDNPLGPVLWHEDLYAGRWFECPRYRASEPDTVLGEDGTMRWTASIHMPRSASRILLGITNVRVRRVQEATHGDIERQGIPIHKDHPLGPTLLNQAWHYEAFRNAWDSHYAKRGWGWDTNWPCWAITFWRLKP